MSYKIKTIRRFSDKGDTPYHISQIKIETETQTHRRVSSDPIESNLVSHREFTLIENNDNRGDYSSV